MKPLYDRIKLNICLMKLEMPVKLTNTPWIGFVIGSWPLPFAPEIKFGIKIRKHIYLILVLILLEMFI